MNDIDSATTLEMPARRGLGNIAENGVERLLFASRWMLVPLYLGLIVVLAGFVIKFFQELIHFIPHVLDLSETDLVLTALALVDLVLVANLLIMILISGYENFVSRIQTREADRLSWLGKLDAGTLKIKLAISIIAISSIHLLKAFMNAKETGTETLMWLVIIHLTFVASALVLAVIDKLAFAAHRDH